MLKIMLLAAPLLLGSIAQAQLTTAFTYQGRLKNSGQNASGLYDLEFKLFNAATGGTQLGPTSCANNVLVADGLFTATLDFGQQYATPGQRFIEVAVRSDSGLDCSNEAGFFVLTPRSPLPVVPQAAHAHNAFALDLPDGSHPGAVTVNNSGKVGVGTTNPQATLHLMTQGEGVHVQGSAPSSANEAWIGFLDAFGTPLGYVGDATPNDNAMYLGSRVGDVRLVAGSSPVLIAKPDGKIGISTTTPLVTLDVHGDIRLGPFGQYRALAASENLRVIQGVIDFDGGVISGPGFTVTHPGTGRYNVSFNADFEATPAVTVTVMESVGANTVFAMTQSPTVNSVNIEVFQRGSGAAADRVVSFIAIGPR